MLRKCAECLCGTCKLTMTCAEGCKDCGSQDVERNMETYECERYTPRDTN